MTHVRKPTVPRSAITAAPEAPTYDALQKVVEFESDLLTEAETIELFQHMIDTGLVWTLQGAYGRYADRLINDGVCHMPENDD